ncbi:MAG: hypothetical protein HC906_06405 [Bacteroidales bacterium]|nr:hypothetical protein [Bacteroidales bacterium]
MESGSSLRWSLFGHHELAPNCSQATPAQKSPFLSFSQTKPPCHGGFSAMPGLPE